MSEPKLCWLDKRSCPQACKAWSESGCETLLALGFIAETLDRLVRAMGDLKEELARR